MKLDFNFQIKNLDGKDFEGENYHCGKVQGIKFTFFLAMPVIRLS